MIKLLRQTVYAKKAKSWLEGLAKIVPLSPNQITISAVVLALLGFLAIYSNQLTLGFLLFLISGFLDAFDGVVARTKRRATNFGFFLDGVSDRIVEFLFILSFFFLPFTGISKEIMLLLLLFFSVAIPYVKAYADHSHAITHAQTLKMGGIFERSERLILFYLILISSIFSLGQVSTILLFIGVFLGFVTLAQRIYFVSKNYSKKVNY